MSGANLCAFCSVQIIQGDNLGPTDKLHLTLPEAGSLTLKVHLNSFSDEVGFEVDSSQPTGADTDTRHLPNPLSPLCLLLPRAKGGSLLDLRSASLCVTL